jgi:pyruvate/2-oxoglutarate dehydrogenase complex dihydrolipoamide acyltransferase (E2) component
MIQTRLELPYMDRTVDSGTVNKWFKQPGDTIIAGDHLCELLVEMQTVLEVPRNAKMLTRLSKKSNVSTTARKKRRPVTWRVIAREPGTLESIIAGSELVEIGTTLAVIEVSGGEDESEVDIASLPEFRVFGERAPEEGDEN